MAPPVPYDEEAIVSLLRPASAAQYFDTVVRDIFAPVVSVTDKAPAISKQRIAVVATVVVGTGIVSFYSAYGFLGSSRLEGAMCTAAKMALQDS